MALELTRILVVDDSVDGADSAVELLTLWGYEAVACYDGATALESARLHRPTLVLLDLAMPLMNGFQFAVLFHELPECHLVPLIAMSGFSSLAYYASARTVGIQHYLLKPVNPAQLKEVLAREVEEFESAVPYRLVELPHVNSLLTMPVAHGHHRKARETVERLILSPVGQYQRGTLGDFSPR